MANLADILAALGKLYLGAKAVSAGLGDLRAASPPLPKLGKPKIKIKRVNGLEGMMREIMAKAKQGSVDPRVRQLAVKVLSRKCGKDKHGRTVWCTPEKGWENEIKTMFRYVRNEVRYVHDIWSVDTYQHPLRTLEMHGADCLPEGTLLVRKPYDFVPIEEIKPGDQILDGSGWTEVTSFQDKGALPVLRFELNNGCVLRCTAEHRVFRVTKSGGEKFVEEVAAGNLKPGDSLWQPKTLPAGVVSMDPDRALIVGAHIAEGWVQENAKRACIAGVPNGKGLRERVIEASNRLGLRMTEQSRWLAFYGQDVVDWLRPCGHRAINKRVPSLDIDLAAAETLLGALEQGDGGYAISGTMVFSTTSPLLAMQHRILHRMFGRSTHIRRVDEHGGLGSNPVYRCTVRNGVKDLRPDAKIKSISIEEDPVPVYDIETVSGRLYLPESDVVVHNCDDLSILLASLLLSVGYEVKFRVIRSVGSDDWNHILVMVGVPPNRPTKWIPLDASVKHEAGWYPPNHIIAATRDFPVR